MHTRTLGAAALTTALVLLPTAAHAAGSDSPTPYTVTASSLTLPPGTTFEQNGHINYRVTNLDGSGATRFNVHQSVPHNNQWPQAAYVGSSTYGWTDHPSFLATFPDGHCITWVQVSLFNEHFGEGGQAPVCTAPTEPIAPPVEPIAPPVEPQPPVEPIAPPVEPQPPVEPIAPPVEPQPPVEPVVPTAPVIPGTPVDTEGPDTPAARPATDSEFIAEVLSSSTPVTSEVLATPIGRLASTGLPAAAVAALSVAAVAGGSALVVLAGRRHAAPDAES